MMHASNDPTITTLADTHAANPEDTDPTLRKVTKCYANRENDLPSLTLTPRQQTAISLMCSGLNLEVAAAKLKISRMTLYRWRHTHPAFIAELSRRQRELRDLASRRLRKHLLEALETVADHFLNARNEEDRVKTALSLLRHADLPSLLSAGVDDPAIPTLALDHLIRQDWTSRNCHPDRQVDNYDRDQYLKDLAEEDSLDPDTAPTHRRLAGTPNSSPESYPTPDNAPKPESNG